MHIVIAGNIGAGKTTLTKLLAQHYKWEPHFENVDNNPYLDDFYRDMKRWSFNLQIYFLRTRFQQIVKIKKSDKTVIQDRSIYEDAYIFAPNLYEMGLMSHRDFENYRQLFELISSLVSPPDLLIYLKASVPTLVKQIEKRGRDYEKNISIEYLKKLNEKYNNWIETYDKSKHIIIDVDNLDFINNKKDFGYILERIDAELYGLF
jgi:deoxyadenosine/deoxycytidine kinase